MIPITDFFSSFPPEIYSRSKDYPWEIMLELKEIIESLVAELDHTYVIENGIAVHKTAVIEQGVTFKAPIIIGANCRVSANAYFREGVFLAESVKIGPGCEIKSSIICAESAIAHFNYIGNSLIGSRVNFEAGSIAANHFNERVDKEIRVRYRGEILLTGLTKFGSIVGDDSKIGANAVLSPGTILKKKTIVKRLELIEQM
jgi:NDP-sugar pyrophosphorylase family protein